MHELSSTGIPAKLRNIAMPSKLKKAIGAVKDQTSISLAKVSSTSTSANLEVTILKATSHDVVPINDKYVHEILTLISSSKFNAVACAQTIAKRIGKTRNWIVALKSLMLVLRIFQDGDPYFPIEVLHAMKRGAKILNLSNFKDDSTSCPWDYTAFVRNFALYLDERLDCFLTGKLQRRFTYQRNQDCIIINNNRNRRRGNEPVVREMKPAVLLDRIQFWQKLLDRAIATIPSGVAKTNRLILISLSAVVQETYDLYRDISDGLALLLDSFFHLHYQSSLSAFHACVKASKQFEDLSSFYATCKALGVGRTSEYPSVQKISEELIETLQEFVKDQASFPGRSPPYHLNQNIKDKWTETSPKQFELASSEPYEGTASDRGSAFGSACTSLSDLMSVGGIENGASPSRSAEQDYLTSEEQLSEKTLSPIQSPLPEFMVGSNDKALSQSAPQIDLLDFFPLQQTDQVQQANQEDEKPQWELVLFESANQSGATETSPITSPPPNLFASLSPATMSPNLLESSSSPDLDYFFQNSSTSNALHISNPFLQDITQVEGFAIPTSNETTSNVGLENLDDFSFPSTSQSSATPLFSMPSSNGSTLATTFVAESTKQSTTSPTFSSHNSNERGVPPVVCATNTTDNTMVQALYATSLKETETRPTFSGQSGEGSSMSPSFRAQCKNRSITAPTFQTEVPSNTTFAVSFCEGNFKETEMAPTFSAQRREGSSMSPTFCAQNTNNSLTAPTLQAEFPNDRTLALPISAENSLESAMSQNFGELTLYNGSVAPSFRSEEPNEFMAVPTFSTTSTSDNETPKVFGSPFAIQNDDPFGPFSGATSTSEPMCNGTINQEALLHQQRRWLEQQNKIIAKHLT